MDLRDLWRDDPRVTPRYVLRLVGQLSDTSALAASVRGGGEFRSWTLQNTLLAAAANLLHAANQQRAGRKHISALIKLPKRKGAKRVVRVADVLARQAKQQAQE